MPFIPVPNTAQVNILMTLHGQRCQNTLYFERPGGWTADTLTELIENVVEPMVEIADLYLSNELKYVRVDAFDLTTASGAFASSTNLATNEGEANNAGLPGNVAAVVSFRTAQRGKSFRGRNYVPGLTETGVQGNTLGEFQRNSLTQAYETMLEGLNIGNVETTWVVVSRFTGGAKPNPSEPRAQGVTTPVTQVVVDTRVASMRRRLTGRGN